MPSQRMAGPARFSPVWLLLLCSLAGCSKAYCQQGYWERVAQGTAGNPFMLGPSMAASGLLGLTCEEPVYAGTSPTAATQVNAQEPVDAPAPEPANAAATDDSSEGAADRCRWIAEEYHWQCW